MAVLSRSIGSALSAKPMEREDRALSQIQRQRSIPDRKSVIDYRKLSPAHNYLFNYELCSIHWCCLGSQLLPKGEKEGGKGGQLQQKLIRCKNITA